jgi:CHAD domain-containing protein
MSDVTTHREIEYKLRVHALFRLPDLTGVCAGVTTVEPQRTFTMRNIYYDTADLKLLRWRVTLRKREGGPDEGWHLKLPVDSRPGVRDELQVPLTDGAVPEELRSIIRALIRTAPLGPVVTLVSERSPLQLRNAAGIITAELVDDTVTVLDGERAAAVFREIEVEGVPDAEGCIDEPTLISIVNSLVAAGAVPGTASKAAAALGPRTSSPCDVPDVHWQDLNEPAGEAVRAYLATHVRRLLLEDVRLRRGLPDAIHQLRVAARRIRSGLHVFSPLLDRDFADELRTELSWAAGSLGIARDTEVLVDRLRDHCHRLSAIHAGLILDKSIPTLDRELVNETTLALERMNSPRYITLLETLVQAATDPPLTPLAERSAKHVLPPLTTRAMRRLRRDVRSLRLTDPSATWHSTRIAAKKARYAVECVAPVLGHDYTQLAQRLSAATDILGAHQDAHVAQHTLERLAQQADGPTGYALGLLHAVEVDAERQDREKFMRKIWPRVRQAAKRTGS